MWDKVIKRIKEPSTWAGLASLMVVAAQVVPTLVKDPEFARTLFQFLTAASALVAIIRHDIRSTVLILPPEPKVSDDIVTAPPTVLHQD